MLGDPTGTISRNFDVMIEEEGLALRGTFIIDPDGMIKTAEINDLGIGRSAADLVRKSSGCSAYCCQSRSGMSSFMNRGRNP